MRKALFILGSLFLIIGLLYAADKAQLLSDFEVLDDWSMTKGDGTDLEVKSVKGKDGKAIELVYDLKDTRQWVAIFKNFELEVSKNDEFKFQVKGSGELNNIEFKLTDVDGSNFTRAFDGMSNKAEWTAISVPVSSLHHGWGGDKNLDMVTEIWICVIFKNGKKGTLTVDNLEYIKK